MGCLSFHHSIRIWSMIFRSGIIGLKAISGCSRIFRFSHVHPTYNCPPLIATQGHLSLGPTSPFVCRLRICLICTLALLGLIIPLPRLDCPMSRLWSCSAVSPPAAASVRFVFPPRARPRPHLAYMLPKCPPQPLTWFGIWSMKEFYNPNCDVWDVLEEFFQWLDVSNENWGLVHPSQTWIISLSTSGHLFVITSISMGCVQWNRMVTVSIIS